MKASRWLSGLTRRLRDAGVVVPPSRLLDAARALVALDAAPDLPLMRDALRVVLTQSREEGRAFDGVFNRYMAAHARALRKRRGPRALPGGAGGAGSSSPPATLPLERAPGSGSAPTSVRPPGSSPPSTTARPASARPTNTPATARPASDRPASPSTTGRPENATARPAHTPAPAPPTSPSTPSRPTNTPATARSASPPTAASPAAQSSESRGRGHGGPDAPPPQPGGARGSSDATGHPHDVDSLDEMGDAALGAWIEAVVAEAEADGEDGQRGAVQRHNAPTSRRAAERAVVRKTMAALESEGRVELPELPLYSPLTPAEDALILDTVRRMARLMWIRRARRSRRWKSGRISVKSTVTHSVRSGGIPFKLVRRKRKLRLARLLLLLDVSGSVRTAARFLLALAQALRRAFSSVRAFAFVDRPVDATALLERDPLPALEGALPDVDWLGKSDYGNTFYKLLEEHDGAPTRDTLLVVLGDARNNYADPMPWTLAQIRTRVGRLIWLNPEPRRRWHTADSALAAYAPYCDALELCASTADLRHIADRWLHLAARWR